MRSEKRNKEVAQKIYPMLIQLAKKRETIFYADLVSQLKKIGIKDYFPQIVGEPLGVIQKYCKVNKLPLLTAVVVAKNDSDNAYAGTPSNGFEWVHIGYDYDNDLNGDEDYAWCLKLWKKEVKKVYEFDWSTIINPKFVDN